MKEAETNGEVYSELVDQYGLRNLLVFSPETYEQENELNVRIFAEFFGISEDPATGASNGCLVAYLTEHQYFSTSETDARVEQGYEVNRPSLLIVLVAMARREHRKIANWFQSWRTKLRPIVGRLVIAAMLLVGAFFLLDAGWWFATREFFVVC